MVVCKYFIEGYCKFGSRCKYEHPLQGYDSTLPLNYSSDGRQTGTSVLKRSTTVSFGGQEFNHNYPQRPQQNESLVGLKFNIQEVMHIVLKDIMQSEKGNQWQLSSYSPVKELANIPGLEDHSPEELRWEFYRAVQNGSLPLCQALVHQLYSNVSKINNDLKKKETGYAIIESYLRNEEARRQVNNPQFTLLQQPVNAQVYDAFESNQPFVSHSLNQNLQSFQSGCAPNILESLLNTIGDEVYSTEEELAQELEIYKADRFVFGAIPTKPPPKTLCRTNLL